MPSIVAIGDSLTHGHPLDNSELTNYLRILLGANYTVTDKGVDGDTTTQMLARFATDVVALAPDYVIIWGGVNDIAQDVAIGTIESNLQAMFTAAYNASIKVLSINISPWKDSPVWTSGRQTVTLSLNSWLASGSPTNVDYKLDIYAILNDSGADGCVLAAYDSGDHIHLTNGGYDLIASHSLTAMGFAMPGVSRIGGFPAAGDPTAGNTYLSSGYTCIDKTQSMVAGTINQIKLWVINNSAGYFIFKIFRQNGTYLDYVCESEQIPYTDLVAGLNFITIYSTLACQLGDLLGFYVSSSDLAVAVDTGAVGGSARYISGDITSNTLESSFSSGSWGQEVQGWGDLPSSGPSIPLLMANYRRRRMQ